MVGRWEVAVEGTPFGRYRLVELLGRGGMGEVWRAYDTGTDRVVALKVLAANLHDDVIYQERFRREARAAAGLDEPHVVPIHDFGEIDGRLYVTMRLLKGDDLQELIAGGPLEPARAVWIIEQIASALHAAHTIGLVHRDIKPSNIVVAEDDFAYLIDFGIAQAEGDSRLTHTGTTIGTWAYMAPERFASGSADARADIYALACVLHEALTGQLPFPNVSNAELIVAHMRHPPPRPSAVRPGIPTAMDGVIAVGMAKEPGSRYATAKDLARAAKAALAAPPPAPERRHTPAPPTARAAFSTPPPGPQRPLTPAPDAPTERAVRDTPSPAPRRPQTPTPQRPQTPAPQPMRPPRPSGCSSTHRRTGPAYPAGGCLRRTGGRIRHGRRHRRTGRCGSIHRTSPRLTPARNSSSTPTASTGGSFASGPNRWPRRSPDGSASRITDCSSSPPVRPGIRRHP